LVEIREHCTGELLGIVDCDVSRDTIAVDDILLEDLADCCEAYIREGLPLFPFHEVFNFHNGEGVVTLCGG
jgi:hypothetical protein